MFQTEKNRIYMEDGQGKTIAEITFPETSAGVYTIDHTFVDDSLRGLGYSYNAEYYGIVDAEEARQYLAHPVLGARLREITTALLELHESDPLRVMGRPDDLKLCSSMTLFEYVAGKDSVFGKVLDKYYAGRRDAATLRML